MNYCARCGAPESDDVRCAKADPSEVFDLYEGARQRAFTAEQIDYLRGCVQITHAKSYKAGQAAERLAVEGRARIAAQMERGAA